MVGRPCNAAGHPEIGHEGHDSSEERGLGIAQPKGRSTGPSDAKGEDLYDQNLPQAAGIVRFFHRKGPGSKPRLTAASPIKPMTLG